MADKTLNQAIESADTERLQKIVKDLCQRSSDSKEFVEKELLTDETEPADSKETSKDSNGVPQQGKKRARYAICLRCREEYDVSKNLKDSCLRHEGELEQDSEFWVDHDEDCHGPIDEDEMKVEYPEGFRWDCCEEHADSKGCETGYHEEDTSHWPKGAKRYRWSYGP